MELPSSPIWPSSLGALGSPETMVDLCLIVKNSLGKKYSSKSEKKLCYTQPVSASLWPRQRTPCLCSTNSCKTQVFLACGRLFSLIQVTIFVCAEWSQKLSEKDPTLPREYPQAMTGFLTVFVVMHWCETPGKCQDRVCGKQAGCSCSLYIEVKSIIEKGHHACCVGFIVAGSDTHRCAHSFECGKYGTDSQQHIFSLRLHWYN